MLCNNYHCFWYFFDYLISLQSSNWQGQAPSIRNYCPEPFLFKDIKKSFNLTEKLWKTSLRKTKQNMIISDRPKDYNFTLYELILFKAAGNFLFLSFSLRYEWAKKQSWPGSQNLLRICSKTGWWIDNLQDT